MKQAGSNFVTTCMDVQGNINVARAISQYGLKATQLWLSGNDQSTLDQNQSLMQASTSTSRTYPSRRRRTCTPA
jgi:hypothetical protein